MQKLEEIMRAEEAARHTVAQARERADAIVKNAEAESSELVVRTKAETAEEAARLRDERLATAEADAGVARTAAAEELASVLGAARDRVDAAAAAAIKALAG